MAKTKTNHGEMHNATYSFDVPGESVLALYNAVTFTLANADKYVNDVDDCENCLDAMNAFRQYLMQIINRSPIYVTPKKPSN